MRLARMWILAAVVSLATASGSTSELVALPMEAGSSDPVPQSKPKPARVVQIVIDKANFGETPAGIAIGDTIEWVNNDIFDHTTTSKTGGWDVTIPAGKKARVVMKKAGIFDYVCTYHPNMTGVVRVGKR